MARPIKDGLDYFPHDVHAFNDKKIEALRMVHGIIGYAFYFIILEQVYQEHNFELDISDAETIQILCRKMEITEDKFEQLLQTSLKHGCFDRDEYEKRHVLTSNGIKKRACLIIEKREKMREKYQKTKEIISDAETQEETDTEMQQSKVKKRKEKKIYNPPISPLEEKQRFGEFVTMTNVEYQKLIDTYGEEFTKRCIEVLDNYKGAKGKKYKSDYRAILNWVVERVEGEKQKVIPMSQRKRETDWDAIEKALQEAESSGY